MRDIASRAARGLDFVWIDEGVAPEPYRPVPREAIWFACILVLGVALRACGLRLGLPYWHHWDESHVVASAGAMIDHHNDVPANFYYGAPLMRLTALAGALAERLHLPGAAGHDEIFLRWVGRIIALAISSTGMIAAYLAARFALREGVASLACMLLYATAAELVWHARYAVTDCSVAALTTWALAAAALYFERRTLAAAALAIAIAGLAFAFKLPGLMVAVIPVGALLLRAPLRIASARETAPRGPLFTAASRALLLLAVPAVLAIYFVLNPHVTTHWPQSFAEITKMTDHYALGHYKPYHYREAGLPHLGAALHYLAFQSLHRDPIASGAIAAVSVFGLALAIRRRRLAVLLGLGEAFCLVWQLAMHTRAYVARAYLPAVPISCLGFGAAIACAWTHAAGRARRPALIAAPLALVLIAGTVHDAVGAARLSEDARARAMSWIAEHAPASVAWTPSVDGASFGSHGAIFVRLARPDVRVLLGRMKSAAEAQASGADFVLVASHFEEPGGPYEQSCDLDSVPGYHEVARFEANPYEDRFEISPWWDGRVDAMVLARDGR